MRCEEDNEYKTKNQKFSKQQKQIFVAWICKWVGSLSQYKFIKIFSIWKNITTSFTKIFGKITITISEIVVRVDVDDKVDDIFGVSHSPDSKHHNQNPIEML